MIHLTALLAIAMLLGLNYTHALGTHPRGLFTLLCTWENLNACMALAMTEHFHSSTIVIEVNID